MFANSFIKNEERKLKKDWLVTEYDMWYEITRGNGFSYHSFHSYEVKYEW